MAKSCRDGVKPPPNKQTTGDTKIDGPSGRQWTCSSVIELVRRTAAALCHRFGVGKDTVVCFVLPNSPEVALLLHGAMLAGAIVTTCNPGFTKGELRFQLEDCRAALVITSNDNVEKVEQAKQGLRFCKDIVVLGKTKAGSPHTSVYDLFRSPCHFQLPELNIKPRDDTAMILYSSGTTGQPKGVMLTHYNCVANICLFSHPDLKMGTSSDTYLAVTPFFHAYGINVILNVGLCLGVTIVTMPRFLPQIYLEYIQKYKVSFLHVAPPIALFLSQSPLVDEYDISSAHTLFSGGAPLSRSVAVAVKHRLRLDDVRQGYGMTEAGPGLLCSLPGEDRPESVGVVMANTEAKVIDPESGKMLPAQKFGEICARGPQVMKGYHGNQEASSLTVDTDGWLHTGDLGYYDEVGKFYIVDRLKELIKYNAFQVAPAELESVLLSHPKITDAAVIGKPDAKAGELPVAFVTVEERSLTAQQIMEYVAERVAGYKRLRGGVVFVDSIPKSPSGKILRRFLRTRIQYKL